MLRKALITGLASSLVALAGGALADDTDVYVNPNATVPANSEPIVMFSLDYRPNLASTYNCGQGQCQFLIDEGYLSPVGPYVYFDILRAALRKVFDPLEGLKIGLMLNHNNVNNCENSVTPGCSNGGFIALGAESMQAGDANGAKARFHKYLADMPLPLGNLSHPYQGVELFFELYRYLTGQELWNAHVGFTDYQLVSDPDFAPNTNMDIDTPDTMWDPSVEAGNRYISPLEKAGICTEMYTVNIMFQVSNQEADSDREIRKTVAGGGMGLIRPEFPDVVGWLNGRDLADGRHGQIGDLDGVQNVTSYFLTDFNNTVTDGYALAGGTGASLPLSQNPQELVDTLTDVFKQILSVSTTFVAASIPVNSFNRAEVIDNVYLGLFQPNQNVTPYWYGNVKKLRLRGLNTSGIPVLVDADGDPAIAADGRIRFDALTYWTDPTATDVANFDPAKGEVGGKDGRTVYRGGSGHKTPGFIAPAVNARNATSGGRQIYYDATDTSLADFDAESGVASALQADLGAASEAEALRLISYARGTDVLDEDGDNDTSDTRAWLMASTLHSRPLPINYGARGSYTSTNPEVYVLVGSNDGMIRMLRNTPPSAGATEQASPYGEEVWAFTPRAVMGVHKYLHDNATTKGAKHTYGVDGAPAVYIEEDGDGTIEAGEKVWAFFGLRRGGKAVYGMDLSDPVNPRLLWVKEKGDAGFADLGYTFSTPTVGKVNLGGVRTPVVIFGGGFDTQYDDLGVPAGDPEGNTIYVVNAATGALVKSFTHPELLDSIPSPVSAVDVDGDDLLDRIYTGTLGGDVFRADLTESGDPADWTITRIAALGLRAGDEDRRFFHKPDVVLSKDGSGNFDAVVIGSGHRSDPLETSIQNTFYMLKDRNTLTPPPAGIEPLKNGDLVDITGCTDCATPLDLANGWRLDLTAAGEKNLSTPLTLGGIVFFTTYIPAGAGSPSSSCGPSEGTGRFYSVGLQDGRPLVNLDKPITDQDDAGTPEDRYDPLRSPGIPSEVVAIPPNRILRPDLQIQPVPVTTRMRTFWYPTEEPSP
jgi:type IV pilus assembly protein PilY1